MRKIVEIHIHHSEKPDISDWYEKGSQKILDWIKNYHKKNRGWLDIGYHFLVMPDGTIWDGRSIKIDPASIKGRNKGAIAICIVGNFDNEEISELQFDAVIRLTRGLMRNYHLTKDNVKFHREFSDKTCPGMTIKKEEFLKNL